MRPSFSHSSDTTHIALSLTGSGISCSSISTSTIPLVALESFVLADDSRLSFKHMCLEAIVEHYDDLSSGACASR